MKNIKITFLDVVLFSLGLLTLLSFLLLEAKEILLYRLSFLKTTPLFNLL